MLIKGGFQLAFECTAKTPMLLMINARPERELDFVEPEKITFFPAITSSNYKDAFGNICTRIIAPPGRLSIWNRFLMSDPGIPETFPEGARQHPIEELPDDILVYLIGSRYCDTQKLSALAWSLFGALAPGWPLVKAILDYVHQHLTFSYPNAHDDRTAWDAHEERNGVCRDFAHLAITLCRCMNIPARYCTGYLGDIGVPKDPAPMDFSAWFEVYLGGTWYVLDTISRERGASLWRRGGMLPTRLSASRSGPRYCASSPSSPRKIVHEAPD
jgi:transglutaminase-like putative cysteine protease